MFNSPIKNFTYGLLNNCLIIVVLCQLYGLTLCQANKKSLIGPVYYTQIIIKLQTHHIYILTMTKWCCSRPWSFKACACCWARQSIPTIAGVRSSPSVKVGINRHSTIAWVPRCRANSYNNYTNYTQLCIGAAYVWLTLTSGSRSRPGTISGACTGHGRWTRWRCITIVTCVCSSAISTIVVHTHNTITWWS